MISSLDDAWKWYTSVKELTLAMFAMGAKHWNSLPWDGDLGRDDRLRDIEAPEILDWAKGVLGDLDDLCVMLLFSVFEATVRERALADVAAELPTLRHPALQHAVRTLNEALEHGSFYKVTEAYKGLDPDLIEQVNQVRKYRNWVAHGRRGEPQNSVDPNTAYTRLQRFLDRLAEVPPKP
ncbi:MAG TPA: hypothetical protein VKA46_34380 [Gemmataceae bacterium]|nr:hypothetical protein [Gemmataceae bacterium]